MRNTLRERAEEHRNPAILKKHERSRALKFHCLLCNVVKR